MSSFDQIVELIADDLSAVEAKLTEQTASEYSFVDMAVQHVVEGGGNGSVRFLSCFLPKSVDMKARMHTRLPPLLSSSMSHRLFMTMYLTKLPSPRTRNATYKVGQ